MRENPVFPIVWDIDLVQSSSYFGRRTSITRFLSLQLRAFSENDNSSVVEVLSKNEYGNWVESKVQIGMPEVFEISDYAARLAARKNDFTIGSVVDTSDISFETLITIRNGLGEQNQPLSFYISEMLGGLTGRDAPLTDEFLRCLFTLTSR